MYQIVLTGPESTGKTTLATALAQYYKTSWVPEYARTYLENLGRKYLEEDLLQIAKGQIKKIATHLPEANNHLFMDTSMLVLYVWAMYKYGRVHPWIEGQLSTQKVDLYLLCGIDTPWVTDPLREHPLAEQRAELYTIYKNKLEELNVPYVELSGAIEERLEQAIQAIEAIS